MTGLQTSTSTPTTLDGIKRLAKRIRAQQGLQHARALDQAAVQSGFNNWIDATRRLPVRPPSAGPRKPNVRPGYAVRITIGWRDREARQAGVESLSVRLSRPLLEVVSPAQMRIADRLGHLRVIGDNHLAARDLDHSQQSARWAICQALRTLQFIDVTGLRPSTSRYRAYPNGAYRAEAPGVDHPTTWYDPKAKAYLIADEPYPMSDSRLQERAAWADEHGFIIAKADRWGMYRPDGGVEFYLITDGRKGYDPSPLIAAVNALGAPISEAPWSGTSTAFDAARLQPQRSA